MRMIKFRAKRVNGGEWVKSMTISYGTIKRKMYNVFFEVEPNKWVGVIPETVCQFSEITVLTRLINGDYYDIKAYYAWIGWKESRESMKAIKLPVLPITMPINYRIGFSNAVNRCEDAITSAGYEVEE